MTRRGIFTWLGGYLAGCLVTGASIGTLERYHATAARAAVAITEVGDIGDHDPTPGEVTSCQTINAGEMIYAPQLDAWRCEAD